MPSPSVSRRIRAGRPAKQPVDPWRPLDARWEDERTADGAPARVLTVFLAGAECPFTCVFCDLWRFTLDGPTPAGAIPAQLEHALAATSSVPAGAAVKLYNAGNFFDDRAVPPTDDAAIAGLLGPFSRTIVECHPRLVGRRCFAFAERLEATLEVAMGLETIHPAALPRLNKEMDLADFDRAAEALRERDLGVRAFVLVGVPYVPPEETVPWVVRTVEHALRRGASHVSLIPVRSGGSALAGLARDGSFTPPTLRQLEGALEACVERPEGVVTADLWDAERLLTCTCSADRVARVRTMNQTGRVEKPVRCARCGGAG